MTAAGTGTAAVPDRRRVRLVFGGLVLTILLASLDQTILSSALPTIVGDLGGVELMPWVITAYLLAATIVMPAYGRLGDLIGRKGLFLAAIGVFLLGSAIGGFATSVEWLIVGRAVQGLGGGGLVITAQAIVADVVPARERGRYAGVLGGVFAVSSVAGPLLGGWFTDVLGWRWCFWINLPLGAVALVVAAVVLQLPAGSARGRPRIDAWGITWSAAAVTCVVLLSSWAGTTHAWTSPTIIGLAVGAVVAALLFVQMVGGNRASTAGLLMIPMMAGLLASSIISGQLIARTGRYKAHPVAGMAVAGGALALMSTMDARTGSLVSSLYLLLFGIGIGLVMQVLVLLVQNAADPALMGTATAATNFFREIGASLGVAVVGAVFTARLTAGLTAALPADSGVPADALTPDRVAGLPPGLRATVVDTYAAALTPVLGWLVPLFAVGLVLVALLPDLPLRTTLATAEPAAVAPRPGRPIPGEA